MGTHFGKYDIPPTLQKLIQLQESLQDAEQFFTGFHFYLSLNGFRYFNTPCDVIEFGNIGADGIHYGFLTDYGTVTDLEAAPIVCVSPMNFDRPSRVVANNLSEFLNVNLNDGALFYNDFESEESYLLQKRQWAEQALNSPYQPTDIERITRERITIWTVNNVPTPAIDNPYTYVQNVSLVRQNEITLQTQDGLGVKFPFAEGEEHLPYRIHDVIDLDMGWLEDYLNSAPVTSRLALIRDIQKNHDIRDQQDLRAIIIPALHLMSLDDEAIRIL